VIARQDCSFDKDAAEAIGISARTVKQWKADGAPIDDAVRLMALDGLIVATELRRRHVAKAMAVKVAGLDEDDNKLRQGVATEIIEWEMGKATQRTEESGDKTVTLRVVYDEPRAAGSPADTASETG